MVPQTLHIQRKMQYQWNLYSEYFLSQEHIKYVN